MELRPLVVLLAFLAAGCWPTETPLAPELKGSIGLPHDGVLSGASELPHHGTGYVRLRRDRVRYGNPRLVSSIQRAAAAVQKSRPGAPVVIGDLSARHGGKIPRHRSHRTGRDVDLLFYVVTPAGRSVRNPAFIHFRPDGLALLDKKKDEWLRFDTARNWLLVKALVTDRQAQVQWLFVARWLEALIIEYALALGEADDVVWHASKVMHQPGDSFPHDDHFHMRIGCGSEVVHGCAGGGYHWPWFDRRPKPIVLSDAQVVSALLDDPDVPRP